MGRYDGEDYGDWGPHEHQWALNGQCRLCHRSREAIEAEARRILGIKEPDPT